MQRAAQLEAMRRLIALQEDPTRETARTTELDVARYVDPAQHDAERAALFRRRPIPVVHASELAEPGAYRTIDLAGTPLVLVRNGETIEVLVNACRHRGARVVSAADGRCKAFTCPYHAWSFRLDGALFHVPARESFEGLDLARYNLRRVAHEVRHGFVWVGLDHDPDAELGIAEFLGPTIDGDFASFGLRDHRVEACSDRTLHANWKLVMDAFAEGYHLKSLHRDTLSRFFLDLAVVDDQAPHVRQVGARKTLLETRSLPEDEWDLRRDTTVFYNLFPNSILVFHPYWVTWLTLIPQTVDSVRVIHRALVPADALADEQNRESFTKSFAHIDAGVFEREDFAIAQSIQSTLASEANETVVLGAREEGMRLFHAARDAALADAVR